MADLGLGGPVEQVGMRPLTRERVMEEVRKVRYVKDNTILVNLNDSKNFKRTKDGKYAAA